MFNKCQYNTNSFFPDLEVELQQANIGEPRSVWRPRWFGPSPSGPQPHWLYRAVLLLRPDLLKTPAAGGERPQRDPPSYLHNGVITRKLLDVWTQVRNKKISLFYGNLKPSFFFLKPFIGHRKCTFEASIYIWFMGGKYIIIQIELMGFACS